MKLRKGLWVAFVVLLTSCTEKAPFEEEFTGNEITYQLQQASEYNIEGAVTFKERFDGSAIIEIQLMGTEGDVYFPAHLHYGDIFQPDAEMAAQLTPVYGVSGKSSTLINSLANEEQVTYEELLKMDGHIKVHLAADGYDYKTILAAGNIGSNGIEISKDTFSGRISIPVCKPY